MEGAAKVQNPLRVVVPVVTMADVSKPSIHGLRGHALLTEPSLNKGTAFTLQERAALGLEGLLPPQVSTLQQQVRRAYENITRKTDPLERYIGLVALQDRNQTLFYRLLLDHLEEFLPVVYTPTVGLACQRYSHIYRRPRGLWITPQHRGRIASVLRNAPCHDVRLIVVTDNERILGLGDQGAGGIAIAIGKCILYTLGAGIHPDTALPISLDVGTDNAQLLEDELYLGWRQKRLRGPEYDSLVEEFVTAVQQCFPQALLQWEDFKKQNAFTLLQRYRDRLLSFNDDIQGTSAIGTAAVLAGGRASQTPLAQQRIVMVGAGAAGIGIARQLRGLLAGAGLSGPQLQAAIAVLDSEGFLHEGRQITEATKREFAWPVELAHACGLPLQNPNDLLAIVKAVRPTVLVGTAGQPGLFTRQVVQEMARHVDRPVILPFSNPNSKAEAEPADLVDWTEGRALVATGSPFDPVNWRGRTLRIGQGNNVFVFPGIGLGALVAGASAVTDEMFTVAAAELAAQVSEDDLRDGALFPRLRHLRGITARIAAAVVRQAQRQGLAKPMEESRIGLAVAAAMWDPAYGPLQIA